MNRHLQLGRLGIDLVRVRCHREGPGRDAARRLVAARLGRMRGLPQKIGQLLSFGEQQEHDGIFSTLTDAAEPVPAAAAFEWIAEALGSPLTNVFQVLDEQGAAASLGQVHRGMLRDGRCVAVKVQYPNIRQWLEADLSALGILAAPLADGRSAFDVDDYRRELRRSLLAELDYDAEVATLERFAARAREMPGLVTPYPIRQWCTSQVITMSWVEGERLAAAERWPQPIRRELGLVLLRVFLRSCFVWGELHADPHAGNFRFDRTAAQPAVGMLDFGCVKRIDEQTRDAFALLVQHAHDMNNRELLQAYVAAGFKPALLEPIAARLRDVTTVLFAPFYTRGAHDPRGWRLSERLAEVLGEDRWNFRVAGPASLLFLVRAFQGLVHQMSRLDAVVDWRRELADVQPSAPAAVDAREISSTAVRGDAVSMAATSLKLRVMRGDEQIVQLSFAATAAAHLSDLVPPDLHDRVSERGIDLRHISARAVAQGFQPGELLTLNQDDRTIRVWLE